MFKQPSQTGPGPKATLAAWLGHAGDSALGTDFSDTSTPPGPARVPQNAPCLCLLTWEHYQGATVSLGFTRGGKPQRPRPGVRSLSRAGPAGPRASARRSAVWTFVAHPHRPQSQSNLLPPPSLLPPPRPLFALNTPICTLRKPIHEPFSGLSTQWCGCYHCLQPRATSFQICLLSH